MKSKLIAGILVTLFLVTTVFSGIQVKAEPKTLRVGVVGPVGMMQWNGLWEGAQMARDEVNSWNGGQGIVVGTDNYQIQLVQIDSHAYPVIDPAGGVIALTNALTTGDGLDFLIGGFRTECVNPMVETFVAYCDAKNDSASYPQPVWYIAGAATDSLMAQVNKSLPTGNPDYPTSYDKYRYMFRVTPMTSSFLVSAFITFAAGWVISHQLIPMYGANGLPPVNAYIVAENLAWCDAMPGALLGALAHPTSPVNIYPGYTAPSPLCKYMGLARPAWDETDFSSILTDIENKDVRIVFHVFSALGGAPFIKQFGEREIDAVAVGINVESQAAEFYSTIGGKCEYESFLASVGSRTPIWEALGWGTATQDFWDDYLARFGHAPIYTAWGAYDGIIGFSEFMEDQAGWPMLYDDYIPLLEVTARQGLLGYFKFTQSDFETLGLGLGPVTARHDVYCEDLLNTWLGFHYVRTQLPQWQNGVLEVVWPRDQMYSRKYKIPPWMYEMSEADWYGAKDISDYPNPTIGPDGVVDIGDLGGFLAWQASPTTLGILEADMDGNNFINILDISKVAVHYDYNASEPANYGQWPLP